MNPRTDSDENIGKGLVAETDLYLQHLEGMTFPTCKKCGYTLWDCRFHMDHYLCGEPEPAPPSATPNEDKP